jgi:formate--tetrahydrofolate ligase
VRRAQRLFSFITTPTPHRGQLETIAKRIYHAASVELTPNAKKQAEQSDCAGFAACPSAWPRPITPSRTTRRFWRAAGFQVTVRNLKVSAGAGFIVALTGTS